MSNNSVVLFAETISCISRLQVYGAAQLHKAETLSCSLPTTSQHYTASLKPVSDEKTEDTQDSRGYKINATASDAITIHKCTNHWSLMQHMQPGLVSLLVSEVEQGRSILNN